MRHVCTSGDFLRYRRSCGRWWCVTMTTASLGSVIACVWRRRSSHSQSLCLRGFNILSRFFLPVIRSFIQYSRTASVVLHYNTVPAGQAAVAIHWRFRSCVVWFSSITFAIHCPLFRLWRRSTWSPTTDVNITGVMTCDMTRDRVKKS